MEWRRRPGKGECSVERRVGAALSRGTFRQCTDRPMVNMVTMADRTVRLIPAAQTGTGRQGSSPPPPPPPEAEPFPPLPASAAAATSRRRRDFRVIRPAPSRAVSRSGPAHESRLERRAADRAGWARPAAQTPPEPHQSGAPAAVAAAP